MARLAVAPADRSDDGTTRTRREVVAALTVHGRPGQMVSEPGAELSDENPPHENLPRQLHCAGFGTRVQVRQPGVDPCRGDREGAGYGGEG